GDGSRKAERSARTSPGQKPRTGNEVHALRKALAVLLRHDNRPLRMNGYFASSTASRKSHFALPIWSNYSGIDIAVAIDLSAADKTDINQSALQVEVETADHRTDHLRVARQHGIADRKRQPLRPGADHPGLENQNQIGGLQLESQTGSQIWHSNPNQDSFAIAQAASCFHDHHLGG